jgi:hypothetical protein
MSAFRVHPAVVFTPLDDQEGILLHLDTKRYYSLNETGRRIWELASQGRTSTEIARTLTHEYAVDWDVARDRTDALLGELATEQLLVA